MSIIKTINFKLLGDDRGSLVALEGNKSIPFEIKRVFYIFGTKQGISRGNHAHRNLKQVAVCLNGSCRFLLDDGVHQETIILDKPTKGLLIEGLIWNEMHDFTTDCVLMVLASEYYNERDYIRDYHAFVNEVHEQG